MPEDNGLKSYEQKYIMGNYIPFAPIHWVYQDSYECEWHHYRDQEGNLKSISFGKLVVYYSKKKSHVVFLKYQSIVLAESLLWIL